MTKKLLYTFAALGVAVVLGAAGCQQSSDDMSANENQQQNADMQAEENAEADTGMMDEGNGEVMQNEGTTTDNGGDAMMNDQTVTGSVTGDSGAMMDSSEVKTFTVEGQNFSYSPSTISVSKGDKVKIIFKNVGGTHDWNLDEFGAKTPIIQTGQTAEVTFTADKAGTFEYYCSVGSHRAMGMVGTLTVK